MRGGLMTAAALAGAATLGAVPASAAGLSHRYRVVRASSRSTATHADPSGSRGRSTVRWRLRAPGGGVSNVGGLIEGAFGVQGSVAFNVRGVYRARVTTPNGTCSLSAPTGTARHPAAAPETGSVAFAGTGGRVRVTFLVPGASLQNPYFGSECRIDDPAPDALEATISRRRLRRRRVTLVTRGHRAGYAWRTSVTLERLGSGS